MTDTTALERGIGAAPTRARRRRFQWRDPWGHPRGLALVTWIYILWSIVPVLLAIRFAFNSGRSRSAAQGWSLRWFWKDPNLSVFHDPTLSSALQQSLTLAFFAMLIATPLGVALALGLQRWRGPGSGTANVLTLLPLVTPELVFAVGLFLDLALVQTVGMSSLIFLTVGYGAGRLRELRDPQGAVVPIVVGVLATVVAQLGFALMQFLLGKDVPMDIDLIWQIVLTVGINAVIAFPVYSLVRRWLLPALPEDPRRRRRRAYTTGGLSPLSRA